MTNTTYFKQPAAESLRPMNLFNQNYSFKTTVEEMQILPEFDIFSKSTKLWRFHHDHHNIHTISHSIRVWNFGTKLASENAGTNHPIPVLCFSLSLYPNQKNPLPRIF